MTVNQDDSYVSEKSLSHLEEEELFQVVEEVSYVEWVLGEE